jgi:hypothetical protein
MMEDFGSIGGTFWDWKFSRGQMLFAGEGGLGVAEGNLLEFGVEAVCCKLSRPDDFSSAIRRRHAVGAEG